MERYILCFQIPDFQVALARLAEPRLRRWPVAVADSSARPFLTEISAEAREQGLFPGMPVGEAASVCRSLRIVRIDGEYVRTTQRALLDILRDFAAIGEAAGLGHFYLDLSETAPLFGRALDMASRMERQIGERCGLNGLAAVASSKLVSAIAARLIPQHPNLRGVKAGTERKFLAPVPVAALPGLQRLYGGRTGEVLAVLDDFNLDTLGRLADIPLADLQLLLGVKANLLRQWALGVDPTPVWPDHRRPTIEVGHTLVRDEINEGVLAALLYSLLERLCRQLRLQRRVCRTVGLSWVYSDGVEVTRGQELDNDTCWEAEIYPKLHGLFFRWFTRRVCIRRMTLTAEKVVLTKQLCRFSTDKEEAFYRSSRLSSLDSEKKEYGDNAIA